MVCAEKSLNLSRRATKRYRNMNLFINRTCLLTIALVLLFFNSNCFPQTHNALPPEKVTLHNQAVALMGQFNFEAAQDLFAKLTREFPDHAGLQINHAISILNRQREGDEALALAMLRQVLKRDEQNLVALYCCGLVELHMGHLDRALKYFKKVLAGDQGDPTAHYFTAKTLMQMSRYQEALAYFNRATDLDPFMNSAYYNIIMTLRQLGKKDAAAQKIVEYRKIKNDPRGRVVDFKYTKMGKKAEVQTFNSDRKSVPVPNQDPLFKSPVPIDLPLAVTTYRIDNSRPDVRPAMTICDINGDGFLDLFIPGLLENGENALLMGSPKPTWFKPATDHPLNQVDQVNTALWGDINDDGLTDVYLCRNGINQLWQQDKNGQWQDVTAITHTGHENLNTVDGALFDADHDGDLDIFIINSNGPNELFNNNRDGTFRPLAANYGLKGNGQSSRSIVISDLDNDRDVDIIVINQTPPHEIYLNDRLWKYKKEGGFQELIHADIRAIVAGDRDNNGLPELYTLDESKKITVWQTDSSHTWIKHLLGGKDRSLTDDRFDFVKLSLSDVDGNGDIDLIRSASDGWQAYSFAANGLRPLFQAALKSGKLMRDMAVLATPKGPAVVGVPTESTPLIWMPDTGRFPFLQLTLTGRKNADANLRSNTSGIGTKISVRRGSDWTVTDTFRNNSGPGQSLQPVCIGLRDASQADFVTLAWPDGVLQTEIGLEKNRLHPIAETQRQMSSCPVLFAWNGAKYVFVSDILGVGGIGYAVGPGIYATPRPWENFIFSEGLPTPQDGQLKIKIMEPMEEVAYLDVVGLTVYDLPEGWSMTMDERMGISAPLPTGKPVFYKDLLMPIQAVNERGEDVTAHIIERDFFAAPVGSLDRRFIGRLETEHALTLYFNKTLDSSKSVPTLVMDGWVEYPYSQTSFAAWQAGADYRAPTIEIQRPDGSWGILLEQAGYPAGMPRQMSLPLPGLPAGVKAIRIKTNQEIYWDKIFVALAQPCPDVRIEHLDLSTALLEYTGFPLRIDFDQRRPYYDISQREISWHSRIPEGDYTRFGDVKELLLTKDNSLAILGPGEGIHLEFSAPSEPVPSGWTRRYVTNTHGWCKDMDLYTNTGDTVAPVPFEGDRTEDTERLHQRYNIRYRAGWFR